MALCRLECPICQQNLLMTPSNDEGDDDDSRISLRNEDGHRETRYRSSWSWSPVSTSCGHLFHKCCIMEWFRSRRNYEGTSRLRGSCPTCRKSIATYSLVRLYLTASSSEPVPATAATASTSTSDASNLASSNASEHSNLSRRILVSPLPDSDQISDISSTPSSFYSDFFNLGIDRRSRIDDILRLRRSLRPNPRVEDDLSNLVTNCDNPNCLELRSALSVLRRECRTIQRRLNLEIDVSKMKSILVASQQRDINELKMKKGSPASTWMFTLGFGVMLSIWLTVSIFIIFSIASRFGGNDDYEVSSTLLKELRK